MNNQKQTFDISYKSIIRFVLVSLTLYLIFYLRNIIFIIIISVIVTLIVSPFIDRMQKKGIPRIFSTASLFISIFVFIGVVLYIVAPPLTKEIGSLALHLPDFVNTSEFDLSKVMEKNFDYGLSKTWHDILLEAGKSLKSAASGVVSGIFSLLGGFISAVLVLTISFYFIVEENGIEKFVKEVVPEKQQKRVLEIINKIEIKLGRWFIGQLFLGVIVGLLSFIGLLIIGIPYALILGIVAGVLELVPYIGPVLSGIPAVIIAFTISPFHAVLTVFLYFFIQQFENSVIVPKVMERSVGLHPVVIIISILIGGKFGGITGVILAVPLAAIASIIIDDMRNKTTDK